MSYDYESPSYTLGGLKFVCTCSACPEQYDVFDSKHEKVGYVRLRGGWFRVDCPDCLETTVYEDRSFEPLQGCFHTEFQRLLYLQIAANHINQWIKDANRV